MNKLWLILAGVALLALASRKRSGALTGLAADVELDEDLAQAASNLVNLEEHLFQTYKKTNDPAVLPKMKSARMMRRRAMHKLGCDGPGETWCANKHLLAASMRLREVGDKYAEEGNVGAANECYADSKTCFDLLSIQG